MTTPRVEVDLEEMGGAAAVPPAPTPADLSKIKLEGDGVPAELQGKTAAELIEFNKRLSDALRVSEIARTAAPAPAPAPAAAPVPQKVPEPEYTPDQLRQMFQEDPVGAFNKMQEQWSKTAGAHLEARLLPLVTGGAGMAEQNARVKYAAEFALFENEIKSIVDGMPANQKAALINPAAWDDLIGYVRGKPGNFEKLLKTRADKEIEDAKKLQAIQTQELETGVTLTGGPRNPPQRGARSAPDVTTQKVCDIMGITYEEYLKWSVPA